MGIQEFGRCHSEPGLEVAAENGRRASGGSEHIVDYWGLLCIHCGVLMI